MWAWALLPILLAITAAGGFWTVFAMAVANGAVNLTVEFPYISTCGALPPQSCVFSQVMNVGAFLVAWVCVIRYQQIRDRGCHSPLNTASLVTGCLSALGATLVGNFQTVVEIHVHLAGAFLAFAVGTLYFWLQAALTYQVTPPGDAERWCGPVRILCCALCTATIIAMLWLHLSGRKTSAAICEWVAGMALIFLFGLFAVEFRHVDGHFFRVQRKPAVIQDSTTTLAL